MTVDAQAGAESGSAPAALLTARRSSGPRGIGGDPVHPARRRRFDVLPYLLVAPLVLFIALLAIVPAVWTLIESFFRVDELDPPVRFNGLGNFVTLFSDPILRASFANTGLYVLVGVVLSTILGVAFAVVLQNKFAGRSVLIALLILPWALPGIVAGLIWVGVFDANTGLINSVLTSAHLISNYHVWLGKNAIVTIVLIEIVQVWQMVPLSTLLVLAAMQNIPGEVYEAGTLDGCSRWDSFRMITLPLARPGIAVAAVQAVIATLNVFDQPYALNGQATAGSSVTMQTYFISFQNLNFGEGYALSLLISVVTLIVSFGILKLVYRPVEF